MLMYNIEHTQVEVQEAQNLLQLVDINYSVATNPKEIELTVLYKGEPAGSENYSQIMASLLASPWCVFNGEVVTICSKRVLSLSALSSKCNEYIIETDSDEDYLKSLFLCSSLEEVSRLYNSLTGREVIDHRCDHDHEYTNVNAQRDPDFWDEESITV